MNKYKILWSRSDYGSIIIEAESEQEAQDMFDTGEFNEADLNIKDGGMECESVTIIK